MKGGPIDSSISSEAALEGSGESLLGVLIPLKMAGFSLDEIIQLRKEGLIV